MAEDLRVELKGVQSMRAAETPAFYANLWLDGRRVAIVRSEGRGGPPFVEWLDPQRDEDLQARWRTYCREHAEAAGETFAPHGEPSPWWDEEVAIFRLYDEHEERRWLRRQCRGRTLYRLPGDEKPGEWRTIEHAYTPDVRAFLVEKHGESVIIGNERIR